jgi:hypothetical protein
MFTAIMNVAEVSANTEMVEFLTHQIELLDSRKGSSKPTKTQVENKAIKEAIYAVLSESETPMRVKDMLTDSRLSDYSSSKITALLRQMLPDTGDGRVIKTVEKKVSYFSLA